MLEVVRSEVIDLVLECPKLSPWELAITFTDEIAQFISEASVYRLLRANLLLTSPAFIVMKATSRQRSVASSTNRINADTARASAT